MCFIVKLKDLIEGALDKAKLIPKLERCNFKKFA